MFWMLTLCLTLNLVVDNHSGACDGYASVRLESRLQATHHMILIIFCLAISVASRPEGLNSHYCLT